MSHSDTPKSFAMVNKLLVFTLCAVLAAPVLAGGYGGRYHYGGHYGGHYGYRHHGGGDDGAALLAGLVIGGLVGYLISEDRHYRRPAYRHGSYARPYTRHDYVGYGYGHDYYSFGRAYSGPVYRREWRRPVPQRQVVRVVPQPRRSTTAAPVDRELAGEGCRMTREYTTTIEVDGRERDAYGTKCLTANGSWILGRPRLVPDFDQPNAD